MDCMSFLRSIMKEKEITMTDLEIRVKGKRTGKLKEQIEFNIEKLNKMLAEVGLEISLKELGGKDLNMVPDKHRKFIEQYLIFEGCKV